jgi:hypothetical protein
MYRVTNSQRFNRVVVVMLIAMFLGYCVTLVVSVLIQ